jgi:hypothetical protein
LASIKYDRSPLWPNEYLSHWKEYILLKIYELQFWWCAVVDVLGLRLSINFELSAISFCLPAPLDIFFDDKCFEKFKGTASRDWIGPCIVLMDRPFQAHLSRRFSDFLMALKRVNVLLGLNSVTAQVRLANNVIKGSPGFSIFVPGDLHTINLEDFLAVSYSIFIF